MSKRRRRKRRKQLRHDRPIGLGRKRAAVGAGLSVGAALGMTATAEATDYTVINTNPSGPGSLAQAMIDQNNGGGSDRVLFQSGLSGTITLNDSLTAVYEPLRVLGPGANVLTISGNNAHRIFSVANSGNLTVSGLTLTGGHVTGLDAGGAISSSGELTVLDSTISNSSATSAGGGIYSVGGTLTVQRSTITGNSASLGAGMRIFNSPAAYIQDSTISENTGIGISARYSAPQIQSSTISGNGSFGVYGFYSTPYLTSTLVANSGSAGSPDVGGTSTFHVGFSLIEDGEAATITSSGPNIIGQDPDLGPLGSNGGPTPTNRPSNTSLLLDNGSGGGTDQRAQPRPFDIASIPNALGGNGADIGAVELQAADLAPPAAPTPTPTPTTAEKKKCKKKNKRSAESAKKKKCKKKKKQ
jgi:hypothetical protein